jgi:undecaprenyl pyrophosphate synthase
MFRARKSLCVGFVVATYLAKKKENRKASVRSGGSAACAVTRKRTALASSTTMQYQYQVVLVVVVILFVIVAAFGTWCRTQDSPSDSNSNDNPNQQYADDKSLVLLQLRNRHFPRRSNEPIAAWHARIPPPLKTNISNEDRQDLLHVGIIPDGNRRWSREHGMPYVSGVRTTLDTLKNIARDQNADPTQESSSSPWNRIGSVTVFIASTLNLVHRSQKDIHACIRYLCDTWVELKTKASAKQLRSVYVAWVGDASIGSRWGLDGLIRDIETHTAKDKEEARLCVYLLIDYDPFMKAHNQCRARGKWVDQPFLDLVIRTGNDHRLSGFTPTKAAYAELFFLDKYAPDLTQWDIDACVKEYDRRRKPYGR